MKLALVFLLATSTAVFAAEKKPATGPTQATVTIMAIGSSIHTLSRKYDASSEVRSCMLLAGDRDYEVKIVRNKDGVSAFCHINNME